MIAVDTSTLIAFLRGDPGPDVDALDAALAVGHVVLPPVVVTECLSDPALDRRVLQLVRSLPMLEPTADFWARAGTTRSGVLARGLRARLADTLIAQSCIDGRVPLLTRDEDFGNFTKHAGLRLAL